MRIKGGSLVLAEGGICVVGNLSSQKKDVRDNLQKSTLLKAQLAKSLLSWNTFNLAALETEKVRVAMPKRLGVVDTQQVTWPLRGTVWACADQQERNKAFGKADREILKAHCMQVSGSDLVLLPRTLKNRGFMC